MHTAPASDPMPEHKGQPTPMETLPGCPQRHRTLPSSPNSPVRAANRIEGQHCDRSYCCRIDRVSAPPSECHDEPTTMAQVEHRMVATWARILSTRRKSICAFSSSKGGSARSWHRDMSSCGRRWMCAFQVSLFGYGHLHCAHPYLNLEYRAG